MTEPKPRTADERSVAIIGGGIAGLTAAYDLTRNDPDGRSPSAVTVYEGGPHLGGLAAGFRGRPEWAWPLEHFYHHLFTNDAAIFGLTDELGMDDALKIYSPTTVLHTQGRNYAFDTPLRLLRYPLMSLPSKLRMGAVLAYLRYHPRPPWQTFDKELADAWLRRTMGAGYEATWQPMLQGKFGDHYDQVNLAWFWARVYKRTPKLGYYDGGFQAFIDGLAAKVRDQGVDIQTNSPVKAVAPAADGGYIVETVDGQRRTFDVVLCTVSPGIMQRMVPDLPNHYLAQLRQLKSMGAVAITVALDRQLLRDGTYWVNVPKQEGLPFLALVEHTNMIDPSRYDGDHLIYIGDYLDPNHRYFDMTDEELIAEFLPHLKRFNPYFNRGWVRGAWVHRATYAQPVPPVGYAAMIPDIHTPLSGLYFASMSQVYPWDRGTNYAVEMGRKVAKMMAADMDQPLPHESSWDGDRASATMTNPAPTTVPKSVNSQG